MTSEARRFDMRSFAVLVLAGLLAALPASPARAVDQVKTANDSLLGTVKSVSPLAVVVEERNGTSREVPVNEIKSISFDEEPAVLKTARANIEAGRYEDGLSALADLNPAEISRREIVQDVEYYKAYSAAQLALVGGGNIAEVGRMLLGFVNAQNNSYHYLDAQMLFGDLAGAAGNPQAAQNAYKTVGQKAPWPDYRARAAVALGQSYLSEEKYAEASNWFKVALNTPDTVPGIQACKLSATLGEARCLAASGKLDQAIEMVQNIIKQADAEDSQLLAEAYNAMGASYRAGNRPKDALLAFLHVHLVYFNSPPNHIEALQNLVDLWEEEKMPERAEEAARVLRDRYKRSPR